MPKHLVTAIGLILSLGVIALGVVLVAMPLYFQAVAVDAQTATVADTNAVYQTQIETLREQQENLDEIDGRVAELRGQIPATARLDDVFEVVGRAAGASGVTLTSVVAGQEASFAPRTGTVIQDAAAPSDAAVQPSPESDQEAPQSEGTEPPIADQAPVTGRLQVEFVIEADAGDMAQATAFLDALRAGPRLLNSMTATTNQTGEGTVSVQLTALTYVDSEG